MESTLNIPMSNQTPMSVTKTIRQFGQKLFGFIKSRVKSSEDAEDILQDVFEKLWINRKKVIASGLQKLKPME